MDRESTILELSRSHDLPRSREATPTMEEVLTTTMAPRKETRMEQAAIRTALTQPHLPRRTRVTLLVSSAGRLDTMPLSAMKQRIAMAMEAMGRSPTLLIGDK